MGEQMDANLERATGSWQCSKCNRWLPSAYDCYCEQEKTGDDYATLRKILDAAYDQAANGKGKERHANDLPWDKQPIIEIGKLHGAGFNAGQATKKLQEAQGMVARGQHDAAYREVLGAIVYAASVCLLIERAKK